MYASYYDHGDIVSWLIEGEDSGVVHDIQEGDTAKNSSRQMVSAKSLDRGRSAVMMAAMCGNEAVARTFIKKFGAPVLEETDSAGHTALFHACLCGHGGMVQLLLEAGANANAIDEKRKEGACCRE